jgi:arginyl-tRNA synthetase
MMNLQIALAADIAEGLAAAEKAGAIPAVSKAPSIVVERPSDPELGDYASPIGLALSKQLKRPPMDIIQAIAEHMPKKEYIGKIDAVAPGFLNIRLNPGWMTARLDDLLEGDLTEGINVGEGQRLNFEFISANPTGPLTLGNARTAFSVDTLAKVLTSAGFNVTREFYINDAGAQVKKLGESVVRRALQARGETVEFRDELYQGDYIKDVASVLVERLAENEGKEFTDHDLADAATLERVGSDAAALLLTDIKRMISEDLKIEFDVWTSEKKLRESGAIEEALKLLREKGVTYKDEQGAEFLKTTAFGDSEDRILVKTDGEYAYITPDIAYHRDKFERKFDHIFTFVGADHQGHGPKLMAAMQALGYDVTRLHVVAAQFLRFVRDGQPAKLSKRKGNIYTPRDLIEEVGYDAARYFMTMHALTTHMDFDLGLAQERSEKNPVYYVQYAYVRLQSILRRAKQEGVLVDLEEKIELTSHSALTHTKELALMRELYRYPEVITDIARDFDVHRLAYYVQDVARAVHSFYKHVPVLRSDSDEMQRGRLQLIVAARAVLSHCLDLLGVSKPDVM